MLKSLLKEVLFKMGYQIKKVDNGFSFNPNLDWLNKYSINTVFDIGANEGQFAKFINVRLPEAKIYSFEPIDRCYSKLVELQKKINNLTPSKFALGDFNGDNDIFVNDFTPSSSILKMNNEHIKNFPFTKNTKIEKIKVKRLDDLYIDFEIKKEVLVKIDVQGYEMNVIRGGRDFFRKIPKIVIVEASIIKLYQDEASFDYLFDIFTRMDYKYIGNLNQLYSPIDGSILQIDAIFSRE